MRPGIDEILALDLICLEAPDGGPLDAAGHRQALTQSIVRSEWVWVRRNGILVAYGYLWPMADGAWFVGGLAIHPEHRNAFVTAALGRDMSDLVRRLGIERLESHVRRTNAASLRLHRRLGFAIVKESDRAVAFSIDSAALLARLPARA